jgi:hypothetical protein
MEVIGLHIYSAGKKCSSKQVCCIGKGGVGKYRTVSRDFIGWKYGGFVKGTLVEPISFQEDVNKKPLGHVNFIFVFKSSKANKATLYLQY